ncbi:unnamed protein product [Brugia timori]|uniref:Uncharacterized protein n=1 Tax=Brugia timori TaxID=42155 RepID=A0A0R3QFC6_9BILA|nr:unnamed protein product [Brugia timori]
MVSINERRNDKNGGVKSDKEDVIRNETREYLISTHQYFVTTGIINEDNDMWNKLKKMSKSDTIIVTMIFILFIFLCKEEINNGTSICLRSEQPFKKKKKMKMIVILPLEEEDNHDRDSSFLPSEDDDSHLVLSLYISRLGVVYNGLQ